MSKGVNKVILIGNLGQDPDARYTPAGNPVTGLSLATDESYRDRQTGQMVQQTEWHRVVLFGKPAEIAGQYLRKGSKVYIEGKLQTRKWQNKEGQDVYTTEVVVGVTGTMQMLSTPGGSQEAQGGRSGSGNANGQARGGYADPGGAGGYPEPVDDFDDDIPFDFGGQGPVNNLHRTPASAGFLV